MSEDVLLLCAAVGAVVGAATGLWNSYQFTLLKGRGDEMGKQVTAHVNTPGLHR